MLLVRKGARWRFLIGTVEFHLVRRRIVVLASVRVYDRLPKEQLAAAMVFFQVSYTHFEQADDWLMNVKVVTLVRRERNIPGGARDCKPSTRKGTPRLIV